MRMRCFQLLFVSAFAGAALAAKCPDGWDYFKKSCYLFSNETANWDTAQAKCKSFAGKLVEIETPEEDYFVRSLAEKHDENKHSILAPLVFIGGNDKAVEGNYIWASTGKSIDTFTSWGEDKPNKKSAPHSDCMALWRILDYKWTDTQCWYLNKFICEKSAYLS